MAPKIFIDGEHGTTGLQIVSRLQDRSDIDLMSMPAEQRRDPEVRTKFLREADVAILCLPDDAARGAVALASDAGTRFIDASTAHRTDPAWAFGFAELSDGQAARIAAAQFVSNPGCYSTGAIALIAPLIAAGLLPTDYPVTINAVSGYTGGGKQMIAQMEDASRDDAITAAYFAYALTLAHKHVPEIMRHAGITRRPVFTPAVGRFAQGMLVNVPLHLDLTDASSVAEIHAALDIHYGGSEIVNVVSLADGAPPRLDPEELAGTDRMKLYVCGLEGSGQVNLVASLDNLGKGASGAAVQNLDLMIGG
ncbi:MAG: N-acetyl-gamma-glutamyl-phosphate reductase [Hoeflea sp.]|uniref:N-acetyl-gamma-glutamyl-phosphate reductase n=1 Tax=Hoeflea sp. TaxID=1940281 RepID=UPI001DF5684A|nr:N-acetyl-gamma-glutamyl-phosphate reductase [Hoeflea sp.]MBU4530255.1 N-acetyl-gamma-glutamyl-phosphate reductase [Alphaproteobacteria bacterium]MBU4542479.1 N-acetyl-gamma-glutamyl-phosphate reductase [Alphaproteobacteria bacterium]MBU4551165.1 N-acetyl-gamma-glutamyl-phosphate reductase [Alphaproteobacteria bacterium]MBV1723301.1 N-acetyl-gamma-glutamyl-phosphate reductase [Hoeflea sp.]MBV1760271.1 N-acetyl-gamma-glutamyl-phosphate reductase [Hoeflea sp.]